MQSRIFSKFRKKNRKIMSSLKFILLGTYLTVHKYTMNIIFYHSQDIKAKSNFDRSEDGCTCCPCPFSTDKPCHRRLKCQ